MKTWLIIGCSTGLGRSLAKKALAKGYNVAITARNKDKIIDLSKQYPQTALALCLDVTNKESIQAAIKETIEHFGTIDVLVNNAGYGYRGAVEEGCQEDVDILFNTNLWGPVTLIKEVLPLMRKQRSGVIINISSVVALKTMPGSGYYAASKCALEGLSDGLKEEVAPLGIKVMVVEPGAFRTDFAGRSLTQSNKIIADYNKTAGLRRIGKDKSQGSQPGDPDKGADVIIEAIESNEPPFRLLLGLDAINLADDILESRRKEYDKWRSLSQKTDY